MGLSNDILNHRVYPVCHQGYSTLLSVIPLTTKLHEGVELLTVLSLHLFKIRNEVIGFLHICW